MKRITAVLLAVSMLSLLACGGEGGGSTETTTNQIEEATSETNPTSTAPAYNYPEADYKGHEFKFLSLEEQDWANALIAPEEASGDLISDAMFERNSRISERYNITIVEDRQPIENVASVLQKNVTAGDDVHDVCMLPLHLASGVLTNEYILDLYTVDSLNLDKEWWDQTAIDSIELMDKLYMVTSDISFFPFEATWGIFFNEDMFTDLGLEFPYDLVREGKWTIDKLTEYAKNGALLGGESSYTPYRVGQSSRYGMASHHDFPLALIYGAGGSLMKIENDKAVFNADNERMFDIYAKIAELTSQEGAYYDWNFDYGTEQNITSATEFMKKRFMMCSETLGYLTKFREFDGNFGVLPIPKLDESQDSYHSIIASWGTTMTTIPATASDPERTGVILDALAYDSYVNLMEPYYDTYLTQKGVRNEDSAEMLQIIRETRGIAMDVAYGWTASLHNSLKAKLKVGDAEVASTIESAKASSLSLAEKTLENMAG